MRNPMSPVRSSETTLLRFSMAVVVMMYAADARMTSQAMTVDSLERGGSAGGGASSGSAAGPRGGGPGVCVTAHDRFGRVRGTSQLLCVRCRAVSGSGIVGGRRTVRGGRHG